MAGTLPGRDLKVIEGRSATVDDERVVEECLAGNWEAFDAIVRRYRDRVGSIAARLLPDNSEVEDVVQETFLHSLHSLKRYDRSRPFEYWLFGIAVNVVRNRSRNRWWTKVIRFADVEACDAPADAPSASSGSSPSALALDAVERLKRRALRSAVRKLPPKQREAVVLRYYEGYDVIEIAEIVRMSEAAVRMCLLRACERLRGILEPIYGGQVIES